MTRCAEGAYFVHIAGEWPVQETDEESPFGLLITVRQRGRKPSITSAEPEDPQQPMALECAADLLVEFAREAFRAAYSIRVDVARAQARTAPWPRWCFSIDQFKSLVEAVTETIGSPNHTEVYPISVWLLPHDALEGETAIELFRKLPHDSGLWHRVLSLGVMRIAVFDAYCDLMTHRDEGGRAMQWMRVATQRLVGTDIHWGVTDG